MNDWDNRSTEVAASREVLSGRSGREDQQEAASDSPFSAFGSPLSPAGEVAHSNHEPAESVETIGTTSNHPFWSVDRQEFVQAGSLEIGERLQMLSGDVKVVQQKLPRPGPQPVFNLEVHYEHVYFVGEDGVLVHNNAEYLRNEPRFISELDKSGVSGDDAKFILGRIRDTFTDFDSVRISRTTRERSFWRRWGGENGDGTIGAAKRRGAYGTSGPRTQQYTLEKLAVNPDWPGGDLSRLTPWRIKKGSVIVEGVTGEQSSAVLGRVLPGGGRQILVPGARRGDIIRPRTVE